MIARSVRWGVPILLAIGYFFRNVGLIQHPTLYAEEGLYFLSRVLHGDWNLILAGYMNTFTYFGIWIVSHITITYLPHVLFWISFIVNLIPFFYFLLPHWEKLLPYWHRVAFCVLILLINPWHEGMCQFLYCFWYMGLCVGMFCIEQLYLPEGARRWRSGKIAFAVLTGFSGPVAFMLGVAILAGYFMATLIQCLLARAPLVDGIKSRLSVLKDPLILCVLITGVVQVAISMSMPETRLRLSPKYFLDIPQGALIQLHVMVVLSYLVPYDWMLILNPIVWAVWALLPFTLLLLALPLLEKKRNQSDGQWPQLPVLSWSLGLAVPVLFVIVFAGRAVMLQYYKQVPILDMNGQRYSILQGEIFVLAVVTSFSRVTSWRIKGAYLALFTPLVLLHGFFDFKTRQAIEPVKDWSAIAPLIIDFKNGKLDYVEETVRPNSWTITLQRDHWR